MNRCGAAVPAPGTPCFASRVDPTASASSHSLGSAHTHTRYWWAGIALASLSVIVATVITFYGRRITGWVAAVYAWLQRRRRPPDSLICQNLPVVRGHREARRSRCAGKAEFLKCVIESSFPDHSTPTVIRRRTIPTDDMLDTGLVEEACRCTVPTGPISSQPATASATATPDVRIVCLSAGDRDGPAPANRRTWHCAPTRNAPAKSAQRRDERHAGLAYLVASTARIADRRLAMNRRGVWPRFDDYDHATDIGFCAGEWSVRRDAPLPPTRRQGPDVWWSALVHQRVPGRAPQSTVLLDGPTDKSPRHPGLSAYLAERRPAARQHHGDQPPLPAADRVSWGWRTVNRARSTCPSTMSTSPRLTLRHSPSSWCVRRRLPCDGHSRGPVRELPGDRRTSRRQEVKVAWPNAFTTLSRPTHPTVLTG